MVAIKNFRAERPYMIIDDLSRPGLISALNTRWRGVSDKGDVSLENNGGFLQAVLPLAKDKKTFNASGYTGVQIFVHGNGEQYSIHLRTPDNSRPWQSYRAHFTAAPAWKKIDIPFSGFVPYRHEKPLDKSRLRRISFVAIGRVLQADLAIGGVGLYN
jgi:hypothetical protein